MTTDASNEQPHKKLLETLSMDVASLSPLEREEFLLLREQKARAEGDVHMLQALKLYLDSPFPAEPPKDSA